MSTAGKGLVRPGMPAAVEAVWAGLGGRGLLDRAGLLLSKVPGVHAVGRPGQEWSGC